MLSAEQIAFYHEQGYLHVPGVFSQAEAEELAEHLDWMIATWATDDAGWTGDWRKAYMDEATEKKSKLVALQDLQFYSDAWARATIASRMVEVVGDILGPRVELHHSTMHVKPPETGHPFPMHQDWAFYQHRDERFVDVLVHLDDTCHANGEIRFLAGSHKAGALEHITRTAAGEACTPYLPVDQYKLEDTVAVPARRGDLVLFNIFTIHGSHVNTTDRHRRLVRVGYRDPDNEQTDGQSLGRSCLMVRGQRLRTVGAAHLV